MEEKDLKNLNPDGIEINMDILKEDIEIQKAEDEENLVQDKVNEQPIESLNEEGVEIENADENEQTRSW